MTTAYVLQDGVPLPTVSRRPKQQPSPFKDAINGAKVGQFFFVPERSPRSVSSYVARTSKRTGHKFETRRVWAWYDKVPGVWRICTANANGSIEGVGVWRVS